MAYIIADPERRARGLPFEDSSTPNAIGALVTLKGAIIFLQILQSFSDEDPLRDERPHPLSGRRLFATGTMSGCHWARNVIAHIMKHTQALNIRLDRQTL